MNDQSWQPWAPVIEGGPAWLTLSFILIALGVAFALFVLVWGTRLARRRAHVREELDARGELERGGSTPPVAPPPPPAAEAELPASPAERTAPPAGPAPIADEPIAAAAPLDASPASVAASDPGAPAPAGDDLTRMKGVGPRLAEQLRAAGITRFADLAALTPDEADALDKRLGSFQGRMHRDRWIEQARFLAAGDIAGYEAVFGKL